MTKQTKRHIEFLVEKYGEEVRNYIPANPVECDFYYDFLKKNGFVEIALFNNYKVYNTNYKRSYRKWTVEKIIYSEGFFLVSFPEDYKRSYDSWTPGSLSYCEDNTRYILLLPNEPAKIVIHSYTREEWKEIEITESKIEVEWDGKGNFKSKVEKLQ